MIFSNYHGFIRMWVLHNLRKAYILCEGYGGQLYDEFLNVLDQFNIV